MFLLPPSPLLLFHCTNKLSFFQYLTPAIFLVKFQARGIFLQKIEFFVVFFGVYLTVDHLFV